MIKSIYKFNFHITLNIKAYMNCHVFGGLIFDCLMLLLHLGKIFTQMCRSLERHVSVVVITKPLVNVYYDCSMYLHDTFPLSCTNSWHLSTLKDIQPSK